MSIVRYVNKKTGKVALYESTSHYDPDTKQSRPKRKYLGTEDPETKKLIPSSGKRGRKKGTPNKSEDSQKSTGPDYKLISEQLKKECSEKDAVIKKLELQNKKLRAGIERIKGMACEALGSESPCGASR